MKHRKIAIVGMSYRLPGGTGRTFWDRLVRGEDLVTEVEDGRWAKKKFHHPRKSEPGTAYTFAAGSIPRVADFDAAFFGISRREAEQMDPQQRLLLTLSWEALESAGIPASQLKASKTGVFVGIASYDYVHRLADDMAASDSKTATGNAGSIAANRLSYFYDLKGPSLSVDTACSSALVAFHTACQSIRAGESDCAMVGAVSLHFHPLGFVTFTKTGMLSPTGRCRTFDANADGYVRSEGGGVVLLKPLDQAIRDGDRILGVVEGTGINCDGKTNGITVPSGEAQADLLDEVYTGFGVNPEDLDFLEAHGTGTAIGDPIETWAIGKVLGKRRQHPLNIGSVKSNLGHLETASGMAGLVKVLHMFRHRIIPPNLHFTEPNPRIDFDDLNLRVVTKATPLPEEEPLTVGINSFGFGGANAHLILSAPPARETATKGAAPRAELPFVISAKTPKALHEVAAQTAEFIAAHPELTLYDIAHALYERREWLPRRAMCITKDREALIANLRAYASEQATSMIEAEALPARQKPVFVFTGNGGQWVGMGQALFAENKEFRRAVEEVDGIFCDYAPFSLLEHFQPGASTDLSRTELAQPLIFAVQVGLVRALSAAGIKPAATLGHSLGEVAAAWACGALELEQAVKIIRLRSKHQQSTQNLGGMTAVAAPRSEVEAVLADPSLDGIEVVVSGENSPRSTTIAGSPAALASFENVLTERSMGFKRLDLPYPFHSRLMDSVVPGFAEELGEIFVGEPAIPFYSTVAGRRCNEPLKSEYWEKNIREPVLFREAIEAAAKDGHRIFLEIGPHPVLANHVATTLQSSRIDGHASGLVTKDKSGAEQLDAAAWSLVLGGIDYAWSKHFSRRPKAVAELPNYPWQLEDFALPVSTEGGGLVSNDKEHALLGYRAHGSEWEWENHLDTTGMPWLADHQVGGSSVFPAAGFVEMVLAAGSLRHPDQPVQIEDFEIRTPLILDVRHSKTVRLKLDEHGGHFLISSRDRLSDDPWQPHVTGRIAAQATRTQPPVPQATNDAEMHLGAAEIYDAARKIGLDYGPAFQAVEKVEGSGRLIAAQLGLPAAVEADLGKFLIHPSLLDGSLHSLFALFHHDQQENPSQAFLPVRIDRFVLLKPRTRVTAVRTAIRKHSPRSLMADFYLLDQAGDLVAWASSWRFRAAQLIRRSYDRSRILGQRWVSRPRPSAASAYADGKLGIIAQIKSVADDIANKDLLKRYPVEGDALVDALCAAFALETFRSLADSEGEVSLASCRAGGKVADGMEDYFRRLARMLVQDGFAETCAESDCWWLSPNAEAPTSREIWQSLVADFPEKAARFALLGRIGTHLKDILDGSRRAEEFLPKTAQLSTGSFALPKSALTREAQELLLVALGEHCATAIPHPRRILWITGPRPAEENFLAPWLHGRPGLLTVLLPDTAESQDVSDRLAAYPGVEVVKGQIATEVLGALAREHGCFDAIISPPFLTEEQCEILAANLLPGGLLISCLPERSRFHDFLPLGSDGGLLLGDSSNASVARHFKGLETVALSPAGEGGPSLLFAVREAAERDGAAVAETASFVVIPLDADAEPAAERIATSLAAHGVSKSELLPPFDSEAASVWEKLFDDHHPSHLVFVSAPPADGQPRPAGTTTREICAVSACLKAAAKVRPHCTINIVTSGAFHGQGPSDWMSSALWGFARVARNEFGQLHIRCIDYSADAALPETTNDVASEIATNDSEDEILLRSNGRLAGRVVSQTQLGVGSLGQNERLVLDFDAPGPFQNLMWKRRPAAVPREGEVSIQTKAAGLNFRDVMYAMGLLPDEALEGGFAGQTLGMELSGVVKAVGPGVEDFKPGDEVIAFAPASFASETVTSVGAVIPKPPELSFAAAATIPAAFYTAYHALIELAQIQPGERVLIHGAAGGVGIAAIQIAQHAGAEVYATAGNEEKRDFVRLLGADHVFNSRTLDFADDIMRATNGEGIDVVLNSLAGEAVTKNLEILRPFGRLLELGKRDFYENNRIGLRPFRHNIRYFVVDADQVMALRPDMAARGFRELLELFRQRILAPLPLTIFPAAEAAEAFRYMQHSNQTGKVVLDLSDIPCGPPPRSTKLPHRIFTGEGTYIVSGGWSGFGLETAKWLVAQGARSLALLGRSGPSSVAAQQFVEECRGKGISLLADPCDVTDEKSLGSVLAKIRRDMPPLLGVFHAATVIDDALIMNLEPAKVETVVAPKLTGAALLDRLTRLDPIDHFVLYSSATTFFGNPGQAAYVAANTALEELAAKRRRDGLSATCISWGPIGDTGYLSRHEQIKETLAARTGGQPLESADALRFLGLSLVDSTSQVAWIDLDWGSLARFLPSAGNPRFQMLQHLRGSGSGSADSATDLRRELERMEPAELLDTLKGLLKEEIGTILRVAPDKLDENRSLLEVGMDSLMGVELMTSLETNLGLSIPIMALSEGPTISRLAERLAQVIRPSENAEETAESPLAEQARQLAAQHAAEVGEINMAELVADIEQSKKS